MFTLFRNPRTQQSWNFPSFVYFQKYARKWCSMTFWGRDKATRSFTKFRISAGGHLVFSKGVHLWFWVKIWNLPRVCLWLLWARKFQSGDRVIKTIDQDFKLGFFRRVIVFWLLFIIDPKSYPLSLNNNGLEMEQAIHKICSYSKDKNTMTLTWICRIATLWHKMACILALS